MRICDRAPLICLLMMAALASGCSSETPYTAFQKNDYRRAQRLMKPLVPSETHRDYACQQLHYASCALECGDYYDASTALRQATSVMEEITDGGDAIAVLGKEAAKVYRGDPFEKAMAHCYVAALALIEPDYEKALAASRRALLADEGTRTKVESQRNDFALAHYLAAVAYDRLNETDNAAVHLELAKEFSGPNRMLESDSVESANTIIFLGEGYGPFKTMAGPGGSIERINKRPSPVARMRIAIDGVQQGDTLCLDDLFFEAQCQGWGEMDTVRVSKGVAREVVSRIPLVGVTANLIYSEADIRVWSFLPGEMHIWAGQVDDGLHTITITCYDSGGRLLPRYGQTWFSIPIYEDQDNVFFFRATPDRQNISDKVVVPLREISVAVWK